MAQVIDWTREPGRVDMLLYHLTQLDTLYPYSNKDPDTLRELADQWSEDLRDFKVAEVVLGIQRYRAHGPEDGRGRHDFPVPSQIRMSIKGNRDAGRYPDSMSTAPALEQAPRHGQKPSGIIYDLIAHAVNELGMTGMEAVNWACDEAERIKSKRRPE